MCGLPLLLLSLCEQGPQLRVGVIGTGCIGLEHLRNLHLLPDATVVAIADPHEPSRKKAESCLSSLGDLEGVEVLSDYLALLQLPNVDAVVLCTPNDHHATALPAIVESGKHCLVEKPLCTTIADCARAEHMIRTACEAARARGKRPPVFWCGMEYRYIPSIHRLVKEASEGVVGELRMLSIREHRFPFLRKVGDWNRFNERTGGTLVEKCCHFFDLMRLILQSEVFAPPGFPSWLLHAHAMRVPSAHAAAPSHHGNWGSRCQLRGRAVRRPSCRCDR